MMFLLAGADSWFALRSRSAAAYLQARVLRLVLPLAAGIVSVVLLPLLELLRRPACRRAVATAARLCRRPWTLYVFALPLVASQVALRGRFRSWRASCWPRSGVVLHGPGRGRDTARVKGW